MSDPTPETDFDGFSWHDNVVYGLRFEVGDASLGDWRHNLILDIDHIVEWLCGADGGVTFLVAPATLIFHEVTDLRIDVDFGDSKCITAINEPTIHEITRQPVVDRLRYPDSDYFRWRIALNWPDGGAITFGARGFSQTLRAAPAEFDQQRLPAGSPR